ncbi:ribonuclease R [bacterium]|uniref:ribonuclease R n=1 Tax=Candidatus Ventrenecus sp. TaxID=3085654 RepID=UPI001D871A98|nr:ribonuclease R [bacterium]
MKEQVLETLKKEYDAKTLLQINDLMGFETSEELKDLQDVLEELVKDYVVYKTKKDKYILLANCPSLKIGKYQANKKGFGFVLLNKEDDLYISGENSNGAIDGDIVLAEVLNKGIKPEGHIIKIIERNLHNLVGEIVSFKKGLGLKLDDERLDLNIKLDKKSLQGCVVGHKVLVKLTKEIGRKKYLGEVIKILGHKDDPGTDILSIAYKYDIEPDFSAETKEELLSLPEEVSPSDLIGRRNLTDKMIFTIDGEHTKDIDDAISLEKDGSNYILGVHIADVSNYVKENTGLGNDAYERGTSNYLANTVIPMLPHQLSNGICSLNEGVIRLTMSCVMTINEKGKVIDYDIFESYIKSSKKMTYEAVNDILMRDIIPDGYEPFADTLKEMNVLAHILRKEKMGRGYIDFNLDEPEIIQDENGKAIDIVRVVREDGEKMIEDFMIAANETVASHIYNMDLPFIYRVHGAPNSDKIDDFTNLLKALGYTLKTRTLDMTPKTMQNVLKELDDKPEFKILSSLLLRSMRKAEYSKENIGHFGLASKAYTHFTSPIRRFPDLTVHRLLKKYLVEKDFSMATINYLNNALVSIAEHSSEREVAAQNAERDVDDMKMAEYMESHIGEIYEGVISSVTSFGFFVELPNLIEGLVHVNSLKGDYFNYVPELLSLIGNTTKKTYRIGDKVKVKCVGASKERAMIDFEVVKEDKDTLKKKPKSSK